MINIFGGGNITETKNLGELFLEARKKYTTDKQRNPKPRTKRTTITGISHLSLSKCDDCKQGFTWRYTQQVNNTRHTFQSVDILKLKKRIKDANLKWYIYDENQARITARKAKVSYEELIA